MMPSGPTDYNAMVSGLLGMLPAMPKGGQPLHEASAQARKRFAEGVQPFTDLLTGPFKQLPPARAERLYETIGSMMGPQVGIFAGPKAATANLKALAEAKAMEKAGRYKSDIWEATGWGKGADGKWRFEINDKGAHFWTDAHQQNARNAEIQKANSAVGAGKPQPISPVQLKEEGKLAAFSHPELYDAYPQLKGVKIVPTQGVTGSAHWTGKEIGLAHDFRPRQESSILHELQHAVQDIEGFAKGNNNMTPMPAIIRALVEKEGALRKAGKLKEADEISEILTRTSKLKKGPAYAHSAGEVEARNVQRRKDWDANKRLVIGPDFSEDVARSKQFVFGHK